MTDGLTWPSVPCTQTSVSLSPCRPRTRAPPSVCCVMQLVSSLVSEGIITPVADITNTMMVCPLTAAPTMHKLAGLLTWNLAETYLHASSSASISLPEVRRSFVDGHEASHWEIQFAVPVSRSCLWPLLWHPQSEQYQLVGALHMKALQWCTILHLKYGVALSELGQIWTKSRFNQLHSSNSNHIHPFSWPTALISNESAHPKMHKIYWQSNSLPKTIQTTSKNWDHMFRNQLQPQCIEFPFVRT